MNKKRKIKGHPKVTRTKIKFAALLGLAVVIVGSYFLYNSLTSSAGLNSSNTPLSVQEIPILGKDHVPEGTKVNYNSNPPTSGNHWPEPAEWGFYPSPLPDEQLVHNLEHGGVWISYKDVDAETISKISSIANKYPQAVIITPRQENDARVVLASWGKLVKLEQFDESKIIAFIEAYYNKSPEPLASLKQPVLQVGSRFPDFRVTDVDGRVITRDSLSGKPAIIWFTTSYCEPCQIGARPVSRLDNELGGKAFEVLVIFVDPNERDKDFIWWKKNFANPDWIVASDNELTNLAARVDLRFLDSKFLLDKNGVIKNIDLKVANENYLNIIRQVVRENQ